VTVTMSLFRVVSVRHLRRSGHISKDLRVHGHGSKIKKKFGGSLHRRYPFILYHAPPTPFYTVSK